MNRSATQSITIAIDAPTAQAYNQASSEQRRKLDAVLGLKLREALTTTRPLEEVMRELSRRAQARGLTAEILEELLRDD